VTGILAISNIKLLPRTAAPGVGKNSFMENDAYLFVYGTLRSQMNDPLHRLLETHAVLVGTGTFQGKLYDLGRYPGVVRSHRNTDRVIGEIYRFTDPQRDFEILDEYEGHRFKRKRVTIIQEDGKSITSWIYLYARSVTRRALIRSGDYVQYRNSF
jgi:gamma-glutamylcyclotransferase (GGCT)/AIG2-like uncharacterized protein YtfP